MRRTRSTFAVVATGLAALALLLAAPPPVFPLTLEPAGVITPSGLDTGLLSPTAFWYDDLRGLLVVANTHAGQVAVLNRSGQAVKVLGEDGELAFPLAVAGSREGTLFVAEKNRESLKVLPRYDSPAGGKFEVFDLSPHRKGAPVQPVALFVDEKGSLYVADRGNRQVLVFDRDRRLRFAIPRVGEPSDLWVEASGNILVADLGFGGIAVYDSRGRWLRALGQFSEQFREPLRVRGLAVDRRGRLWVVEEGDEGIKVLDSFGNLLLTLKDGLFSPTDLAIDGQDNLYVLEQGGNRISVFHISEF